MSDDTSPEILHGFVAEARTYLVELNRLLRPAAGDEKPGSLQEGYRLFHCIRGAAAMLELPDVSRAAQEGEDLCEHLAIGDVVFDSAARDRLAGSIQSTEESLARLAITASRNDSAAPSRPETAVFDGTFANAPGDAAPAEAIPSELLDIFLQEAEEHLSSVSGALRELARSSRDPAPLQEIRRRMHTLKGAASMIGFSEVAQLSHSVEDTLDRWFHDGLEISAAGLAVVHRVVDRLEDLLRAPLAQPAEPPAAEPVFPQPAALPELREPDLPAAEPTATGLREQRRVPRDEQVRIPLQRIDPLVRLASDLLVQRSVFERSHQAMVRQTAELSLSVRRLRALAERLEVDFEAAALGGTTLGLAAGRPPGERSDAAGEFDELEMDRYTEFHRLSRSLTETASDLGEVGSELADASMEFEAYLLGQQRLIRELQNGLLQLRAVSLSSLANRLHRAVRATAARSHKQVALDMEGGEVELDRSLLDEMADPFLHLVRNAVDHGIEPPETRLARGKPAAGKIRISARTQGNQVVIEVADDGAGIDWTAVRATAIAQGLLSLEEAAQLSDEAARPLLFRDGFSTAPELTEISGRGVGLDVVHSKVEQLRGTLAVDSTPGQGTRFTVRLPMTLAILRAILVEVGERTFALPTATIERALRLDSGDLLVRDGELCLLLGEESVPVIRLSEVLRLRPDPDAPSVPARQLALLVSFEDRPAVLLVDRLLETREIVVKPLGPLLPRVDGLAGATVLGDGTVVPILDPYALLRAARSPQAPEPLPAPPRSAAPRTLHVLIVDDSLSVRRVLSNLATQAGWTSSAAKDGVEALELLQQARRLPDVLLLDVEMPRMDGYELTATLRAETAWSGLPIVMITSRAGDKHREKAMSLGVSEYLIKPFQPAALVQLVEALARRGRSSSI